MKWLIPAIAATASLLYVSKLSAGNSGNQITDETGADGASAPLIDLEGLVTEMKSTMNTSPADNPSSMSDSGQAMLRNLEGFSPLPYPDHKGYSIGYGHLIKAGEDLPSVTPDQAAALLAADLSWAESAVRNSVTVNINQAQFDALTSFCYNVGQGAFAKSTLVKRINNLDPASSDEFSRWVFASGQQNPALVSRRRTEIAMFDSQGTFS